MSNLDEASYIRFLQTKLQLHAEKGHEVSDNDIHHITKPHQKDIIKWMVKKGSAACFAAFGLGKSVIQLETIRLTLARRGGSGLIVAPLGVRHEFVRDARMLGIELQFIKKTEEVTKDGYYITNYESVRDGKIDVSRFVAASLDEASVLRSFGSKTFQNFLDLFPAVPYRFVATATPAPNSYKELIHYAGFLGVMDTGQALTRFFQRDSQKANNLTIYPHMEGQFWDWMSSWAVFLQRPSDLGYDDTGYDMPGLVVREHRILAAGVTVEPDRDGQGRLLRDPGISLSDAAAVKRSSLGARIKKMMEIISASPDDHFIIWHDLEEERHAIRAALPEVTEVFGSLDLDERESRTEKFATGSVKYFSSKPTISGSGTNLQHHCHRAIFLGIGFKFNDFIQSIHRIRRYMQRHQCEIDIIYSDEEDAVFHTLQRKWTEHDQLTARMTDLIKQRGLACDPAAVTNGRTLNARRREDSGENYTIWCNDTVVEAARMETGSIDLLITSIPFGNHYEYTESLNDLGHNSDNTRFFEQMDFLTPNLLRVLAPGRVACVHVKDRIAFGNVTGMGMPTVNPFHADCIYHYIRHGFAYMGMITVVTGVVRENAQTYRLGYSEQCIDGTKMGVGSPEYVLLFRKLPTDTSRAYADNRVQKSKENYTRGRWQIDAHAFWRSSGNRMLTVDEMLTYSPDRLARAFPEATLNSIYDYDEHVRLAEALDARNALPSGFMVVAPGSHSDDVWHDVTRMRTLNLDQSNAGRAAHICPLQFDIVDRLIERYSAPGEVVFDPFGGIMTVPYRAILKNRRARAVELNETYYQDGLRYLRLCEEEKSIPDLFATEAAA